MVVQRIYLTRHGFRANWAGQDPNPNLGRWPAAPPDCPLSAHGVQQASQLCNYLDSLETPIDAIVSSPFFRCLETIAPLAEALNLPIIPEAGLGEWYGLNRQKADDPKPAPGETLATFFPTLDLTYETIEAPNPDGESIAALFARCSRTLDALIRKLDEHENSPSTVLLCSHAATFVMLCRALGDTGLNDPAKADFIPWTAGITMFERREPKESKLSGSLDQTGTPPTLNGCWVCKTNGDCSFLSSGRERGWRFSGKESFSHDVPNHGVDAGTGLGVVVEDPKEGV
ncbi:Transcription factor tau 55 kDa subunit [Paramyrothecium foliicola]|nr:Transcription factor tau 55 kDa subunit [Paramyrothecium foliicola]